MPRQQPRRGLVLAAERGRRGRNHLVMARQEPCQGLVLPAEQCRLSACHHRYGRVLADMPQRGQRGPRCWTARNRWACQTGTSFWGQVQCLG